MRKVCSVMLMTVMSGLLWAAPEKSAPLKAERPMPPPPPGGEAPAHNGGLQRMYWRVFSRMTTEERKAMMELQVSNPAEFHRKMQAMAENLRAAGEARRKQIDALAERCRTGNEEEKKAAREELTEIFREGYRKRLEDSRRHLKEMEARMKKLAEVLEKKEANAETEVNSMVENCIRGIKPPRRHPSRPFPGAPGR